MLEVYFDNGNKAKLPADKVQFDTRGEVANRLDVYESLAVVNWNHVCFVRKVEKKEDDDE